MMILPALAVACCCAALIASDVWRYPANAMSVMRTTLAALWGAGWLAYGVNLAQFPAPDFQTLFYLTATCAISIAMIPSPGIHPATGALAASATPAWRWYFHLLLAFSVAVVLWDVWHVIDQSRSIGLQDAIITHRWNRTLKVGSYSLPGMEVAHSVAAVTGALGYALWLSARRTEGAVAATIGLASMLTSAGRWDVVAYGLWCLVLEAVFARESSSRRFLASNVRLFALLAVFFIAHGELLSKVGTLQALAEMSVERRATVVNTRGNLGYRGVPAEAANTGEGDTAIARSTVKEDTGDAPVAAVEPRRPCERWTEAQERTNRAFLTMSRIVRVFTLYFAGPFAAFDRAVCESRPAVREVIFYWPLKIARLLHLVPVASTYTVDPFVDIGIPYNNYTLFYPFLGKFGGVGGLLAWLMTALGLRFFVKKMFLGVAGLPGIVAGIGPFAIAVRGLWTNAFFDGSMVVYALVALSGYAVSHLSLSTLAGIWPRRVTGVRSPS
jgi:hypothetical protein